MYRCNNNNRSIFPSQPPRPIYYKQINTWLSTAHAHTARPTKQNLIHFYWLNMEMMFLLLLAVVAIVVARALMTFAFMLLSRTQRIHGLFITGSNVPHTTYMLMTTHTNTQSDLVSAETHYNEVHKQTKIYVYIGIRLSCWSTYRKMKKKKRKNLLKNLHNLTINIY